MLLMVLGIISYSSTICTNFVQIIWVIVLVEHCKNMMLLGLLFPIVWFIQEGIDLTQKEVIILKETGFSFDHSCIRSLFGSQSSSLSNLHVASMNAHNIV
jgi:uncharacterized membrane protein